MLVRHCPFGCRGLYSALGAVWRIDWLATFVHNELACLTQDCDTVYLYDEHEYIYRFHLLKPPMPIVLFPRTARTKIDRLCLDRMRVMQSSEEKTWLEVEYHPRIVLAAN